MPPGHLATYRGQIWRYHPTRAISSCLLCRAHQLPSRPDPSSLEDPADTGEDGRRRRSPAVLAQIPLQGVRPQGFSWRSGGVRNRPAARSASQFCSAKCSVGTASLRRFPGAAPGGDAWPDSRRAGNRSSKPPSRVGGPPSGSAQNRQPVFWRWKQVRNYASLPTRHLDEGGRFSCTRQAGGVVAVARFHRSRRRR